MTTPQNPRQLTRDDVLMLLAELGMRLQARGLVAEIHVVGGAAIALTLDDRRVTQDVDALVLDHQVEFLQESRAVAAAHGIRHDWIADDISGFLAASPEGRESEIALPGLNVFTASPEHLLAMKVRAATLRMSERDSRDVVLLAQHLSMRKPEEIAILVQRQFTGGVYRDSVGFDEYVDTVRDAFLLDGLRHGDGGAMSRARTGRDTHASRPHPRKPTTHVRPTEPQPGSGLDDGPEF